MSKSCWFEYPVEGIFWATACCDKSDMVSCTVCQTHASEVNLTHEGAGIRAVDPHSEIKYHA